MMNAKEHILREFLAAQHVEGTVIDHEYFWDLFGLKKPKGMVNYDEAKKAHMNFNNCMIQLVKDLLKIHKLDLQNVYATGYRLVPYQERIETAVRDMKKRMRRELKKTIDRLIYIPNPENLSYTDQRHRDFALQTAAAMKRDLRAIPRYPK